MADVENDIQAQTASAALIVGVAFHGGARGEGHSFYILDPFDNKLELKGPAEYADGTA